MIQDAWKPEDMECILPEITRPASHVTRAREAFVRAHPEVRRELSCFYYISAFELTSLGLRS